MMDLETLRELQQRGRFFYEMFPGAKAAQEWPLPHASPQNSGDPHPRYRLQGNMRRGTASSLAGTWSPYATLEEARDAAREMLKDDRVLRVTVVEDALPPRFVEWVNR